VSAPRVAFVSLLLAGALALCCAEDVAARTISFSGLTWDVRSGTGAPGNGCWSDDPASVWVDESGYLHLKIRQLADGRWCQAEVTAQSYADYGDHLFWTNSRIDQLGDTIVLGLFLYADDHHEIDVEVTRAFGSANNLHYVVQPYYSGAPRSSYDAPLVLSGPALDSYSSHHFTWSGDGSLAFGSWHGHCATAPCGSEIASWSYTGPNTPPHGELLRPNMNLWIRGAAPSAPQEVIVGRYKGAQVPTPAVSTGAAGALGATSATLAATVNPNGWSSFGWFEYGTASYGSTTEGSRQPVGEGTAAAPIAKTITGLHCGTTYHFRGVASNVAGSAWGADATFRTVECPAPVATTSAASQVSQSSATLGGTVNPNGASTATGFEFGVTPSYGLFVSGQTLSGTTAQPVSAIASPLRCGTTYHFRMRASHPGGTSYGPDATFTTVPCNGATPRWRPVRRGS